MYGRILGFHRLALCPKWTPASIKSFTWTMATHCPPARRPVHEVGDTVHYAPPPPRGGVVKRFIVAFNSRTVKGFCREMSGGGEGKERNNPAGRWGGND